MLYDWPRKDLLREEGYAVMVIATESPREFKGIYEATEVAHFISATLGRGLPLNLSSTKVIRWVRYGLAAPELRHMPGRELFLTFEDLISMRIVAALRAAGVTFPRIHTAERWLRKITGHRRPFATEVLWTERADVFIELRKRLIAASRAGQYAFDILQEYLIPVHGLAFDNQGIATSWEARDNIMLHPLIQFGAPCIKGTRIPTRALWGMAKAGDAIEYVALSYHLPISLIQHAIDWEDSLRRN